MIVRAELSEPAYAYLIAFRPDGTDELCDPDDEDMPPQKKPQPQYPPPTKSDERYRLSEGAGLQAFALVVSRQPLPSYREWKKRSRADGVVRASCRAIRESSGVTTTRVFSPSWPTITPALGARASRPANPAGRPRSWRAGCAACRAWMP